MYMYVNGALMLLPKRRGLLLYLGNVFCRKLTGDLYSMIELQCTCVCAHVREGAGEGRMKGDNTRSKEENEIG